jgi:hypothetical protein
MTTEVYLINQAFELGYDLKSKELTLIHVESVSGHRREFRFDSIASRAIFDLLIQVAQKTGGPIGEDGGAPQKH